VAFFLIWGVLGLHGTQDKPTPVVASVAAKAPGDRQAASGDRVVAVDGRRGTFDQLRHQVNTHRCAGPQTANCVAATPAKLTIERGAARR